MKDIYTNSTYLTNNPTWHEEDSPFKADKIIKLLKKKSLRLESVAEVGSGSGEIIVQLAAKLPQGIRFTGFDISPDAIGIAKKKETGAIQFELKDITDKSDNSHFDLLLVIDVIEHITNYFAFLKSIHSKSTYTVFHIPLDMCLWSLFREKMLIESKERVGHIHNFTEDFIESVLQDYGFNIIDKLYTEPNLINPTNKQKVINFARKTLFAVNKRFCTKTIGGYSLLLLTENKRS